MFICNVCGFYLLSSLYRITLYYSRSGGFLTLISDDCVSNTMSKVTIVNSLSALFENIWSRVSIRVSIAIEV